MPTQTNETNKKNEQSSEEFWRSVSQKLMTKKYEAAIKASLNSLNFDLLKEKFAATFKTGVEKMQEKYFGNSDAKVPELYEGKPFNTPEEVYRHISLTNSFFQKPLFKEIKPNYQFSVKAKNDIPFFPKQTFYKFNNPSFYKNFDLHVLFFIFYYFKGTVQQTWAAIRLKKLAWRYHTKFNIWFQRKEEPTIVMADYEKGKFVFFDFDYSWSFLEKDDFVFEYQYLEHSDYF